MVHYLLWTSSCFVVIGRATARSLAKCRSWILSRRWIGTRPYPTSTMLPFLSMMMEGSCTTSAWKSDLKCTKLRTWLTAPFGFAYWCRDLREETMELTQEQKNEIMKSERVRWGGVWPVLALVCFELIPFSVAPPQADSTARMSMVLAPLGVDRAEVVTRTIGRRRHSRSTPGKKTKMKSIALRMAETRSKFCVWMWGRENELFGWRGSRHFLNFSSFFKVNHIFMSLVSFSGDQFFFSGAFFSFFLFLSLFSANVLSHRKLTTLVSFSFRCIKAPHVLWDPVTLFLFNFALTFLRLFFFLRFCSGSPGSKISPSSVLT